MTLDNSSLLLLTAPAAMLLVSIAAILRPGANPVLVERLSVGAGVFGMYIAAIGVALLINHGPMHSAWLGWQGFGLSVGLDLLSVTAFSMTALLAFYVVRLCRNRMARDRRQAPFLGRLSATIATIQLLLLTGNLAMLVAASVMTGLTLHGLLLFYRERSGTHVSAPSAQLGSPRGI